RIPHRPPPQLPVHDMAGPPRRARPTALIRAPLHLPRPAPRPPPWAGAESWKRARKRAPDEPESTTRRSGIRGLAKSDITLLASGHGRGVVMAEMGVGVEMPKPKVT